MYSEKNVIFSLFLLFIAKKFYILSILWTNLIFVVCMLVVVVSHLTIVAIGYGFLKKFWPMAVGLVSYIHGT